MEKGKTVDTVGEENERSRKEKVVFPTGGGESTNTEKTEALYIPVRSWGIEEEDEIPFPDWKGIYEYRDPVGTNSLSANFVAVFLEVASFLNSRVERIVILNDITQDIEYNYPFYTGI